MAIKPLFDKVVIKVVEKADKTASGIVLPGSAKEKSQTATVVAVGPGGYIDGEKVEMTVKVGEYEGEHYVIVRQADILAVIE